MTHDSTHGVNMNETTQDAPNEVSTATRAAQAAAAVAGLFALVVAGLLVGN